MAILAKNLRYFAAKEDARLSLRSANPNAHALAHLADFQPLAAFQDVGLSDTHRPAPSSETRGFARLTCYSDQHLRPLQVQFQRITNDLSISDSNWR